MWRNRSLYYLIYFHFSRHLEHLIRYNIVKYHYILYNKQPLLFIRKNLTMRHSQYLSILEGSSGNISLYKYIFILSGLVFEEIIVTLHQRNNICFQTMQNIPLFFYYLNDCVIDYKKIDIFIIVL